MTSHIPDKEQVIVRYYGLYAVAHRGKAKKASLVSFEAGSEYFSYFQLILTSDHAAIYHP